LSGTAIPPHVIPAEPGIHPDAANLGPGMGGLVGRRDKHSDDVGGGKGVPGLPLFERATMGD